MTNLSCAHRWNFSTQIFHPGHASGNDDTCCSWSDPSAYFHAPNLALWSGSDPATTKSNGSSWEAVPPEVEAQFPLPDNQTADHAVATLKKLSDDFFDSQNRSEAPRPWFLACGFHKPVTRL